MMRRLSRIICLTSLIVTARAQSPKPGPRFEVADVHPSPRTATPTLRILAGERYEIRNATMPDLIQMAYTVSADSVFGGPNWIEFDKFDVIALLPPDTAPETQKEMLQALLVDRFKLAVHNETRPAPGIVLSIGKGKPRLRETDGSGTPGCRQ